MRAALCVDRHARRAERIDVAMDRALADLQLLARTAAVIAAAGLEQQEQLDEA